MNLMFNVKIFGLMSLFFIYSQDVLANVNSKSIRDSLLQKYSVEYSSSVQLKNLKYETLAQSGEAVPALIEVMKNGKYPEKNRWMATFLLGQIMGEKSAPFIAKFIKHPSWVMRMAALKTLLALKQKDQAKVYVHALKDDSFIVRTQALENIKMLNLKNEAQFVWAMLYDKRNYYEIKGATSKRSNIIKNVVKTIGDLKFEKARNPLLKMIQKDRYNDIFDEMDYSLAMITGKQSPKGDRKLKRQFWSRQLLDQTII